MPSRQERKKTGLALVAGGIATDVLDLNSPESHGLAYVDGNTHGKRMCFWDTCAILWNDLGLLDACDGMLGCR